MARTFNYYHDGWDPALMILLPREFNSVCFMSGADWGYSLSPLHGESFSYFTEEGRFLEVKLKYEWSSDHMHHCVFIEMKSKPGVYVETTGYPCRLVEWLPVTTSITAATFTGTSLPAAAASSSSAQPPPSPLSAASASSSSSQTPPSPLSAAWLDGGGGRGGTSAMEIG